MSDLWASTADILLVNGGTPTTKEIVRIAKDGRIYWNGREVETDDDFRSAMIDLAKALIK